MKSNITLMLLFGLVAILGLLFFQSSESQLNASGKIFPEDFLTDLESIKLIKEGAPIVVSKSAVDVQFGLAQQLKSGQWLVSSPSLAYPNIDSLNKLLSIISRIKPLHQFKSDGVQDFGLATNSLELTSKKRKIVLNIGNSNTLSKRRYAQVQGDSRIILLDDGEISALLKLELRNLTPFNIPLESISSFKIEGPTKYEFSKKGEEFISTTEDELDPLLINQFINQILNTPALKTSTLENHGDRPFAQLHLEWSPVNSTNTQSDIEVWPGANGDYLVEFSSSVFEYGPEFGRLISRKTQSLYNHRLLRDLLLADYTSSCPSVVLKGQCELGQSFIEDLAERFRRVEVLDVERLPGRLMTSTKAECRLKLESSRVSFEIGAKVNGDDASNESSPRYFVADLGTRHYRGVISSVIAKDFCSTVETLCAAVSQSCAG